MSLDGYISGPNHDISAFVMTGDHVDAYFDRIATYPALLTYTAA
ncbi:MAG: hypothetical protein Q8R02_03185 [Hyphomonadaceae bacterium]|nr:hypothetical protein [Hyphomonadaceae bacterium]